MIAKDITDYYLENAQSTFTASNQSDLNCPVIESWICIDIRNKVVILGQLFNHPIYPAGKQVRTSLIQGYIAKAGHVYVTTKNSMYELGTPRQDTEKEILADWGE